MDDRALAASHHSHRAALTAAARDAAGSAWAAVNPADIRRSWAALLPGLLAVITIGQREAAAGASSYLGAVLAAQGRGGDVPAVNAGAFAGVASDGRALATLLAQPAAATLAALSAHVPVSRALASGSAAVQMIAATQVADAGRVADQAVLVGAGVGGYVRMVGGGGCSRCLILAGKWYRWNTGFNRHPNCRCVHIPAGEDAAGDLRTDPKAAFTAMTRSEQDRTFGAAGARAIRDGADPAQVVNARRGAAGLAPAGARLTADERRALRGGRDRGQLETVRLFGRDLYVTSDGATVRGSAGRQLAAATGTTKTAGSRYRRASAVRLMPESIYQIAGDDQAEAVRLLRAHGYLH